MLSMWTPRSLPTHARTGSLQHGRLHGARARNTPHVTLRCDRNARTGTPPPDEGLRTQAEEFHALLHKGDEPDNDDDDDDGGGGGGGGAGDVRPADLNKAKLVIVTKEKAHERCARYVGEGLVST